MNFVDDVIEGTELFVSYDNARYTNAQVREFLVDASRVVSSDLEAGLTLVVSEDAATISDASGVFGGDDINEDLQKLIVFRAAIQMYQEKTNQAADDAIKIKDADTTIDTQATAAAMEKAMARITDEYEKHLMAVRSRYFRGKAVGE